MPHHNIDDWLKEEATERGCKLIGVAEINYDTLGEFITSPTIDKNPAKFVIILAMPLEDPIQDCWSQTPSWPGGKSYLDEVIARVASTLVVKLIKRGYPSKTLGYGGAHLKHLGVYAGLGIIGRNNLLITPQYGPHIRLRAFLTQASLTPSTPLTGRFYPCSKCPTPPPCLKACPSGAFRNMENDNIMQKIPSSGYDKEICRSYSTANLQEIGPFTYLWCRACEKNCPIGNENLPAPI